MKCKYCEEEKQIGEFFTKFRCTACFKLCRQRYYLKNKEKILSYFKARYLGLHPQSKYRKTMTSRGLKKCSYCKQWLSPDAFNKNQCQWDGLNHYCVSCNTIKQRKTYKKNPDLIKAINKKYADSNKHKVVAWSLSKSVFPIRQICEMKDCLELGVRHHDDYDKPKEIRWLCQKHHSIFHKELGFSFVV